VQATRAESTPGPGQNGPRPAAASRAGQVVDRLRPMLREWYGFYHGYEPLFTWWVEEPYRALGEAKGLIVSGGSDYHGDMRPDRGMPGGKHDVMVPDAVLDQLRAALDPDFPLILTLFSPLTLTFRFIGKSAALAHLRTKGAAVEQPSVAERMKDEILVAERHCPPRGANPHTIDMPIERQHP